ncbi:hypothetical protein GRI39_08320 [Altererythrobacter indicus]|uniref:Histidine kinase domain-containing protein n=1 Tax=Altericroceibacterium indicum TaxID=374177 RepID=A0A845ABX2_9SPHN|nr:HAMP domain-containing sensor histidine kinase [Altericroceibacterium indicum]MXP26046.1 hypothetical protein [Altericroceibacterium indicum]
MNELPSLLAQTFVKIRILLSASILLISIPAQSTALPIDAPQSTSRQTTFSSLPLETEIPDQHEQLIKAHKTWTELATGIFIVFFLFFFMVTPLLLLLRRNARKLDNLADYAETIAYHSAGNQGVFVKPHDPERRASNALAFIDAERRRVARKLAKAEQDADALSEELAVATDKADTRLHLLQELTQELRTPLAGVADLLKDMEDQTSKLERDRNIQQIGVTVKTLSSQVEIASLQAHLGGNGLQLFKKPFDLSALLQMIADEFAEKALPQGVSLNIENECHYGLIGDEKRLFKILLNLADCLMKYSGRKHTILTCRPCGDAVDSAINLRFALTESGETIGPERTHLLFDQRAHAAGKDDALRKAQMTLTLCQKVARSLDGSLTFDTSMPGNRSIILEMPFGIATPLPS